MNSWIVGVAFSCSNSLGNSLGIFPNYLRFHINVYTRNSQTFFKTAPFKEIKKPWPLPSRLFKKLPLQIPNTFFLLFICNSKLSSVSFKLWPQGQIFISMLEIKNLKTTKNFKNSPLTSYCPWLTKISPSHFGKLLFKPCNSLFQMTWNKSLCSFTCSFNI